MKVIIYIYIYIDTKLIYIYIYIKVIYIYTYKGYICYIYKGSETLISAKPLLTLNTNVTSGILFIRTIFI